MGRHLGDLIRELREEARLGVRDLERMSGVSSAVISRLENRHQGSVSAENLARLAQALGTTSDELWRRSRDEADAPPRRDWPTLEEWLRRDRNLTDSQREAILRVYQSYVER